MQSPPLDQSVIFADFGEMMRQAVLPMHLAAPGNVRLDSPRTDGNWDVLCRFRWRDRVWKVHMDSHYEPLLLAYYGWHCVAKDEVFVEAPMKNGVRLDIVDSVIGIRPTQHRYLYLYRDENV